MRGGERRRRDEDGRVKGVCLFFCEEEEERERKREERDHASKVEC